MCFLLPHYCSFLYHPFSLCRIIGISPMLWILSKNLIIFSHKIWILHWPYLWLNYLARSFGIHLEVPWIFIPKFSISGCYFWSQRIFLFPFPIYSSLNSISNFLNLDHLFQYVWFLSQVENRRVGGVLFYLNYITHYIFHEPLVPLTTIAVKCTLTKNKFNSDNHCSNSSKLFILLYVPVYV